ncbi:MAG: alpha/beta hydrolase [Chitinophagales bacterium]|nr:alpha/beta hydrolase [Chitinophagales bacterium]
MKLSVVIISLLILSVNSCYRDPAVAGVKRYKDEAYGNDARNKMDVYVPNKSDSNTATVVLIHGGGWVAGDKTNWGSDFINNFTKKGYAVAAINYRYANGDFHNQMNDVRMALEHLNTRASEWKTAVGKFALIGGSAGGHLSLLYAHAFDSAHQVKAAISLVGPTDMTDSVFHQYANNYNIGFVFPLFLGATFDVNPQVYRDASPIFNYSNVPSLFIHGILDDLVPPQQGVRMFDTLTIHGIIADTLMFDNAGHDVFGTKSVNKQKVYNEMNTWLQNHLH